MKHLDALKSYLWDKSVEKSFKVLFGSFDIVFSNRDKDLLDRPLGERQGYYYEAKSVVEGQVVKREVESLMQTLYKDAALDDISPSERVSRRYAMLILNQLLKRIHVLAARAKPADDNISSRM